MPKVLALSSLTGLLWGCRKVRAGTPAGRAVFWFVLAGFDAEVVERDGSGEAPAYTCRVGARETYAWMLLAIETTEICGSGKHGYHLTVRMMREHVRTKRSHLGSKPSLGGR